MKNVFMNVLSQEIGILKKELENHESIMMQMQDALREKDSIIDELNNVMQEDSIKLKEAEHLLSQIGFEWNKRKGCFIRRNKRRC